MSETPMTTTQTTGTPLPEEIEDAIDALYEIPGIGIARTGALRDAIRKYLPQPPGAVDAVRALAELVDAAAALHDRAYDMEQDLGWGRSPNRVPVAMACATVRASLAMARALLASTPPPVLEPEHEGAKTLTRSRWEGDALVWTINGEDVSDADLRAWCASNIPYPLNHVDVVRQRHVDAYAARKSPEDPPAEVVGEGSCPNCEGTGPCDDCREEEPPPAPEDRQEAGPEDTTARLARLLDDLSASTGKDKGTILREAIGLMSAKPLTACPACAGFVDHPDFNEACIRKPGCVGMPPAASPSSTGSQEGGERQALELVLSHHAEECDCDGEERDADGAPYQCVYCIGRLALDPAAVCVRCSTPIRDASPGCTNPHHARRARGGGR